MELNKNKILLFIPCYNCQEQIPRVLKSLKHNNYFENFHEILVIDNISSDDTVLNAVEAVKFLGLHNVSVHTNSINVGLGGTHKVAFRYAQSIGATHVAVLHGDDQGNIEDLINIIKSNLLNDFDCCLGSRFSRDSRLKGYAKFRIFGNYIFNIIYSISSRHLIKDLGAGLNIYKTSAINDPRIIKFSNDLTFNCFLLLYSINQKQKIKYFPVEWREDDQISNVKLFSQATRTLKIALVYLFRGVSGLTSLGDNKINFNEVTLQDKFKMEHTDD